MGPPCEKIATRTFEPPKSSVALVDDHDLFVHHEISMPSPLGINFDQGRRHLEHADAARHGHPYVLFEQSLPHLQDPG
jgi:hypothetical protein